MRALATPPLPSTEPSTARGVVEVSGLVKRFPVRRGLRAAVLHPFDATTVTVLTDVSLSANAGEFLGLLGPNGAGKTTLLKILSTLVLPDDGIATVDGFDVVRDASVVRNLVSPCLAMERSLLHRLTARQNLELYADLQGVPRRERSKRIEEVLQAVSLTDTGDKLVGQFSSGMVQRLLIARALLTQPVLLLLDEPTRSLDPISAREFRRFLRDELARQRGCAVILATHNAEEAFELCDRVAVLDHGRVLASGVASHLSRDFLGIRYRLLTLQPNHAALNDLETQGISILPTVQVEPDGWHEVIIRMDVDHDPSAVLSGLVNQGMRIAAFEQIRPSLADLIEGVVERGKGISA